jgi:hypothetical protein
MNKIMRNISAFILFATLFSACNKDDNGAIDENKMGSVKFEITDAPIDNSSVKAAFITITDIKLDGQSVEAFSKTTIDLMAYQNGNTKTLFDSEFDAQSYSKIELVLDFETDEYGNSPGCYIEEFSSTKHKLTSESNVLKLYDEILVEPNSKAEFVIDFDLRKCIKNQENSNDDKFDFVSVTELESSLRVVSKSNTGVITGNLTNTVTNSDRIVVYAYEKGTYNEEYEVIEQGASNVEFSNAISSSTIDAQGNYEIHFLHEGDYELHYFSYEENEQSEYKIQGALLIDVTSTIDISSVSVGASETTNVNVSVVGLLPI